MWATFVRIMSDISLTTWYGWLTFFAVSLPVVGGLCGFGAWKVGHKIEALKEAATTRVIDDLRSSLAAAQNERDGAFDAAHAARHFTALLQEKQSVWSLTPEQKERFIALLQKSPKGRVAVEYLASDGKRAHAFAAEIKRILEEVGYPVYKTMPSFQQTSGAPMTGVQIRTKNNQSLIVGKPIQQAFQAIGIETGGVRPMANTYGEEYVVILIGMKP